MALLALQLLPSSWIFDYTSDYVHLHSVALILLDTIKGRVLVGASIITIG